MLVPDVKVQIDVTGATRCRQRAVVRRTDVVELDGLRAFITESGNPLTRNRIGKIVRDYTQKAGITGKRVHPHVFRATKAVLFLRHGGDPFTLQKCLGHSTLTMTRRYSAIADADVKSAHLKYGVVDKLKI